MDEDGAMQFLASHGQQKTGNDVIFSWFARYQQAAAAGAAAVNGTVGALLNDDGTLAINTVVDEAIRRAPAPEFAAYAPLKGLPSFLDLSITLALGEHRQTLEGMGVHTLRRLHRAVPVRCTSRPRTSLNAVNPFSCATDIGVPTRGFCEVAAWASAPTLCSQQSPIQRHRCWIWNVSKSASLNWHANNPP